MIPRSSAMAGRSAAVASTCAVLLAMLACTSAPSEPKQRTFAAPEDAVRTLAETVKKGDVTEVVAIFGPDGQELIDSSDPASARHSREVFTVAMAQGWRLTDQGTNRKELIVGHEEWPFPVPLVKDGNLWRFDTPAGKEEVIARRIGRNELAVIEICRTYVAAQRVYAKRAHDGKREGLYAQTFRSDPGRHNGLYWPARHGEKRSPLGDLVTGAEGRPAGGDRSEPSPFHGYFFKILTAQGASAPGGAKDYVANGDMSGGFALVAWPAEYDVTGVMTFIVNNDEIVYEKDLGTETAAVARAMTRYDPDPSWKQVP
jgi:Protein of unknown function (DUF2950)